MKNSFVLYTEYRDHIKLLSNEEKGVLLSAILDYAAGEQPQIDGMALMAFSFIRAQMDRDASAYEEKMAIRQAAGKRGGRPKKDPSEDEETGKAKKANGFLEKAKKANGFLEKQKKPVYVDVNDNVDVYVDVNVDDNVDDNVLNTHNNNVRECENNDFEERDTKKDDVRRSANSVYQSTTPTQNQELFEAFWNAYPLQIDRNEAVLAWNRLNIDRVMCDEIMKGLSDAIQSREWTANEGRFIPYPSNFLSKQLWKKRYDIPTFTTLQTQTRDYEKLESLAHENAMCL